MLYPLLSSVERKTAITKGVINAAAPVNTAIANKKPTNTCIKFSSLEEKKIYFIKMQRKDSIDIFPRHYILISFLIPYYS